MTTDPYAIPDAPPAWAGAWPPHPSWDAPSAPVLPPPPDVPPPADVPAASPVPASPEAAQARAAANALFAPPGAPPPGAKEPWDANLIELEPPGTGAAPAAPPGAPPPGAPGAKEPWDADLIEMGPPGTGAAPANPLAAAGPPNWSGLTGTPATPPGAPPPGAKEPWDANLIELEPSQPGASVSPSDANAPGDVAAPPLTDQEREARLGELLPTLSDQDLAQREYLHNRAAEDKAAAAQAAAAKADRQREEDNERVYRAAQESSRKKFAEIDAEADRLANEKVDPDGWVNSRSLFQKIAMFVAGVAGGFVQNRQGGPNPGLAMIDKAIEEHIDAQKANLAHRRALLGDRRAAAGDQFARDEADYKTEEAFRQGAYRRAIADIESAKQNFDPAGTRSLAYERFKRDLAAKAAASLKAAQEHDMDQKIKVGNFNAMLARDAEAKRQHKSEESRGWAGLAQSDRHWKAEERDKELDRQLRRDEANAKLAPKAEDLRLQAENERNFDSRVVGGGQFIGIKGKNGKPLANEQGLLLQGDGKTVYKAPKDEVAEETRKKMFAASQVSDLIHEVLDIRDKVGGESSWGNSDEYQRLKTVQDRLAILQKSGTQGMSSDEDMKRLAGAVGAADLASFRQRAAGLREGLARTEDELNGWLYNHNYTGQRIEFPNRYTHESNPTDTIESSIKTLQKKPDYELTGNAEWDQYTAPARQAFFGDGGRTDALAQLVKAAGAGDARAAQGLAETASGSPDPETRKAAEDALLQLQRSGNEVATRALSKGRK